MFTSLVGLAALSGCSSDRFSDPGCQSDSQCSTGRVCSQSRCVSLEEAEEDAGRDDDSGPNVEPDTGPDSARFIGRWQMTANGYIEMNDGETNVIEDEPLTVTISVGSEYDLSVQLSEETGFCALPANLTDDGFAFVGEGCSVEGDGVRVTYQEVQGRGRLEGDALIITFETTAAFDQNGPASSAYLELSLEGSRM